MKTADECNQKPPANPVVFAVSILSQITIMKMPCSLAGPPPEWNQTPEYAFAGGQLFDDHFESAAVEHGNKLVIRYGHHEFFPSAVPVPAFPLVGLLNALHRAAQTEDLRGTCQMFEAHELVVLIPSAVPGFENQVAQALGIEMDVALEEGTTNLAPGAVLFLGVEPDAAEFFICEFQSSHD
jgi:hypothetical protein